MPRRMVGERAPRRGSRSRAKAATARPEAIASSSKRQPNTSLRAPRSLIHESVEVGAPRQQSFQHPVVAEQRRADAGEHDAATRTHFFPHTGNKCVRVAADHDPDPNRAGPRGRITGA